MATTSTTTRTGKILIYDGDCPMCRATIARLLAWRLVWPEQTVSNHELSADDLTAARAAGLRNELIVLDPATGELRRGTDGLLWIVRDNRRQRFLVSVLSLAGFRHVLRLGYQTIAYNRRIISPPETRIVCDCEPELTGARRMMLVVPALVFNAVVLCGSGAALFAATGWDRPLDGALAFAASIVAIGLVLGMAALVGMPREKRLDYLGHVAVTLFCGATAFLPIAMLAAFLPREWAMAGFALSAAVSLMISIAMQPRRVAALGLHQAWVLVWVLAAVSAGGACLATAAWLR